MGKARDLATLLNASGQVVASKLASGAAASNLGNYVQSVDGATGSISLDALASFANSKAATGYQKFPNGVIIQWGAVFNATDGSTTNFTFPIAFPNACQSITGNQGQNNGQDQFKNGWLIMSRSTTGFSVLAKTNGTNDFYWMAIGY